MMIGVVIGLAYYLASEMLANSGQVFNFDPAVIAWLPSALLAIVTVIAGLQLPKIQIDTDPENMLRADQADRVFHDEVEERFAGHRADVDAGRVRLAEVCRAEGLRAHHPSPARVAGEVLKLDANLAEQTISTEELRAGLFQGEHELSGLGAFGSFLFTHNTRIALLAFAKESMVFTLAR